MNEESMKKLLSRAHTTANSLLQTLYVFAPNLPDAVLISIREMLETSYIMGTKDALAEANDQLAIALEAQSKKG